MKTKTSMLIVGLAGAVLVPLSFLHADPKEPRANKAFPAKLPLEKPTDRKLSAVMERLYDVWNPHEDRGNEFFSNFKYSRLEAFSRKPNVSRRDPTKVIRINGTYYVWYTSRRTEAPPSGPKKATDTIPSRDWDLADIWYATSKDGFGWKEQGPAVIPEINTQHDGQAEDVLAMWNRKGYGLRNEFPQQHYLFLMTRGTEPTPLA